jgi:hypothetical protein
MTPERMREWAEDRFEPMQLEYNELFARPYQEHSADLDFTEMRLDCVVAQTHVEAWRESVLPAPEAVLDALTDDLLLTLDEGFELCLEAETVGDWRTVTNRFVELNAIAERVYEHIFGSAVVNPTGG